MPRRSRERLFHRLRLWQARQSRLRRMQRRGRSRYRRGNPRRRSTHWRRSSTARNSGSWRRRPGRALERRASQRNGGREKRWAATILVLAGAGRNIRSVTGRSRGLPSLRSSQRLRRMGHPASGDLVMSGLSVWATHPSAQSPHGPRPIRGDPDTRMDGAPSFQSSHISIVVKMV